MLQFLDNLPDPWGNVVKTLVGVIGAVIAIFTSMKMFAIVPQGHQAMKTRFGRVLLGRSEQVRLYDPGVMWLVPFFGGCVLVDRREQHRDLGEICVQLGVYQLRVVSLHLIVRVCDPYEFMYVIDNPLNTVNALARQEAQRLMRSGITATELRIDLCDPSFIAACASYGIEIVRLIVDNDMPDTRMSLANAVAGTDQPITGAIVEESNEHTIVQSRLW